ncbi:hypothetical protein FRC11_008211, partial [Ceratobasidium sp. 423]
MPDESDPNCVAWATRRQCILEPSAEPPPWPNRLGDWYLYEGQTWLLRPLHGTN